ncbi:MAG: hypothetical protein A3B74_03645 [Candidatus Kerfeldbacteria bacterium RIFCSPHIGHO2_02_FULL_42_14]|uniref:GMP synthase n=1 Tax=Candidatus Kerfeldbacteria bacterium RIFCSPHIGHO2_02_FULL_42_14 TaxID=1798540 RepID=A0A1G2APX3_9BACT|nr:MAG: hypothetical protein A3B74_03645 [Candidatus Kerfeldbacteria bacterium RIFCSPHIGHO2_02_FULL_42_14]OGY80611.1 MAG: hypothetical protein A3E60_04140 [Candidatus Kerfeldbacteria bacterium RIFCSPHIGHO2_12_FULL_42_13]OGY82535.1 MAG: hypothetical protein A3I91_03805 [Candidatus Kerfeldbacteria bacterium RIFCSPLOWO2_02_FULL_42_19]OGY87542.1 MAG: hypothetical protein A3G01_00790 [Candidatus Kerfeldbacteria bacterium RIFCSPLOWO2_12_FULL_43_9]
MTDATAAPIHIPPRKPRTPQAKYIRSIVYGGLDGTITTFAIVAGVSGAHLSSQILLILGVANLIADGVSMAFGDFLSTAAEQEYRDAERRYEAWELYHRPEHEKKEIITFYREKGMSKKDAQQLADIFFKYPQSTLDLMMIEEHGILPNQASAWKNALYTFGAFVVFGFVPVLTYVIDFFAHDVVYTFFIASMLTGITLFVLGALKTRITGVAWFRAGLKMLLVGGFAAALSYSIGALLAMLL